MRPLLAALVAALTARPSTASLASVAATFPTEIRLPPYAGTQTYRFASSVRFRTLLESGGRLFALTTAPPGGRALVLEMRGATFAVVPLAGGPYVSIVVRQVAQSSAVLAATTGGRRPVVHHFVLAHGTVARSRAEGDGLRSLPATGLRCLDSRASSAYDGAALVVIDQATGDLRPSISKDALSAATGDASSNLSYALQCHGFGPDAIVWLGDTVPTPAIARPAGLSLFVGARVRPLVGVAPVAVSERYVLFEQGDASAASAELTYTLVRTS